MINYNVRINASRAYREKASFRKIISKSCPPMGGKYCEIRLRHRSGKEVIFICGSKYGEDYKEIGWCSYCCCVTSRSVNGELKYGTTGQFWSYRNPPYRNHVCCDCQPRVDAAQKLMDDISTLQAKLKKLDDL